MKITKFHLTTLCFLTIVLPQFCQAQNWTKAFRSIHQFENKKISKKNLKVRMTADTEPVLKEVAIIDKKVFLEGDIYLGEEADLFNNSRSLVANFAAFKWSNSTIPYTIQDNHPATNMIYAAINRVIKKTNLCLIPRTTETNYVEFTNGNLCFSRIGMHGGKQEIQVSPNCQVGGTVHEILHAAGYFHEHSRSDRDDYVKVNIDNVVPELAHNFEKAPFGSKMGAYDYHSIMHYRPFDFSANGLPTVEIINPGANPPNLGQATVLSEGDIAGVNRIHTNTPSCGLIPITGNLSFQKTGTLTVSGTTLTLSNLIIENSGTTTVPSSTMDMVIFDNNVLLGTIETMTIPTLLAGNTYPIISKSWNLAAINTLPNGTYTFGAWINRNNTVTESTLRDNTLRWHLTTLTKQATTCPDLAITTATVSSYSDNSISVNYQYRNIGTGVADISGPTSSFFDNANVQLALSNDRKYDENDILLGANSIFFNVSPNGQSTGSNNFTNVPINTNAYPYVVLKIDGNSQVTECDENNNEFAVSIAPFVDDCLHPDFVALAAIYNSTNGANWQANFNWDPTGQISCDPCGDNWYGVECVNGRVTELHLEVNNLTGTIPSEIFTLDQLNILYLGGNNLSGCLPSLMSIFCKNNTDVQIENNPNLSTNDFASFCANGTGACNETGNTPLNDACTDAIALSVSNSCAGGTYSNVNATTSPETPTFSCTDVNENRDVWFTAVVPNSGNLTIETFDVPNGLTDMTMQTYKGTCNNLVALVCNDDLNTSNDQFHSQVKLTNQTPNTIIYIRVIAFGGTDTGNFGICAYDTPTITTCIAPNEMGTGNISATQATASWASINNALSYDFQYKNINSTNWITVSNITSNTYVMTDISGDAEWRARTNCNNGQTSEWSNRIPFTVPDVNNCPDLSIAELSINSYTTNSISFNYIYKNRGNAQATVNSSNTTIRAVISKDMIYDVNDVLISSTPLRTTIPAGQVITGFTSVSNTNLQINPATYPYFIIEIDATNSLSECSETNNIYVLSIDDCTRPNTMLLTNNLASGFYSAQASINSNCIIESDKDVQLQAANSITLNADFHAQTGANVKVSIRESTCGNAINFSPRMVQTTPKSNDKSAANGRVVEELSLTIFPNPVRDQATLRYFNSHSNAIQLIVTNLNGQILQRQTLKGGTGWNEIMLDTNSLSEGIYFVSLFNKTAWVNERIVIVN